MAGPAGDYIRGEMDVQEQASTYVAFLAISKWFSLALGAGLLFFILLFCTQAGFIASAISAVVLLALGILFLRAKPQAH